MITNVKTNNNDDLAR